MRSYLLILFATLAGAILVNGAEPAREPERVEVPRGANTRVECDTASGSLSLTVNGKRMIDRPPLVGGCSRTTEPIENAAHRSGGAEPGLDSSEAIRIAKANALNEGIDLRRYERPEAHYEFVRKDDSWFVLFVGQDAMPGNHFAVTIDDRSGQARIHRGR